MFDKIIGFIGAGNMGSAMIGVWQRYARGVIETADLMLYMKRGLIIVCMVFVVMSLF